MARQLGWYVLRRVITAVLTLLGLVTIVFLMTKLIPGNEARVAAGPNATAQQVAALSKQLGLDKPLVVQYGSYLGRLWRGNLGTSIMTYQPVMTGIRQVLPSTIELVILSLVVALVVAVPAATFSALRRTGVSDAASRILLVVAAGLPSFWLALMLQWLFANRFQVFPVSGALSSGFSVPDRTGMTVVDALLAGNLPAAGNALWHITLPALVLALPVAAQVFRTLRVEMIATLEREYVVVARSKGVKTRRLLLRHVLPNAIGSVLTLLGAYVGALVAGAVLVEAIFGLSGIGAYLSNALNGEDIMAVLGAVLAIGVIVVIANFLVDLLQLARDPRVRAKELARTTYG